jgi:hypothetical protein|tara:strand:+ start:251 stop:532 length:282 start_codon:yes stop_codon:yes gene_type:complete
MSENKILTDDKLVVDGNEYFYNELADDQKYAVNQIRNLEAKLSEVEFNANQLRAAKTYFYLTLSSSLSKSDKNKDQTELPLEGEQRHGTEEKD